MKTILSDLFEGKILSHDEAELALLGIGQGKHSEAELASFLTVFNMRPLTPPELAGFRDAMLQLCLHTDLSAFSPIDIVGTGGDGKNTFNISTLASFVLAGAGYKVAKHGNYAVSSTSGSSNVLEYLGYKFSNDKAKLEGELERSGFCFLHAPLFHPAMKFIAPVRKAMKVKTFFNILGPMINPSSPRFQLLGVYNDEVFDLYKGVYEMSGIRYSIVNSLDGFDEVSLTGGTRIASSDTEKILYPAELGFDKVEARELYGGQNVEEAAEIFIRILEGKGTKAQNNVVAANAALAINHFLPEKGLDECAAIASESLLSGKALRSFKNLIC